MKYDRIFFLCQDNTNLSPMAENLFIELYQGPPINVTSRGLVAPYNAPCNPKTELIMEKHGIPMVSPVTRELREEELTESSLVIAMGSGIRNRFHSRYPRIAVCTLAALAGEERELTDPYGGNLMDYERCFQEMSRMMKKAAERLAEAVTSQTGAWNGPGLFEE